MDISEDIKVSVIILTFNHQKYVQQAIDSVINQDVNFNFEIIIADDKSTDQTLAILKEYHLKYPGLINLISRDENIGTTRNICEAFVKSRGKYLIGFGGDDYWIDNKKLQIQSDWLDNNHDFIGVSHVMELRNNDGIATEKFPDPKIIGRVVTPEHYLKGIYFYTSTTMFRNIFRSDKSQEYVTLITKSRLVEDVTLAMILLNIGKVYVIDRCMSVYRRNLDDKDSNYNTLRNPLLSFQDHIEVYNANNRYFSGRYDFSELYANRALYTFIWSIKNEKLAPFLHKFQGIPLKAKLHFLIKFPWFFLKASYFKLKS